MVEQYKQVEAQSVSRSPSRRRYEPEARAGCKMSKENRDQQKRGSNCCILNIMEFRIMS